MLRRTTKIRRSSYCSTTYNRFRTLLVPRIVEWWEKRDAITPSPIPMLKVIAKSLLHTDSEGMNIAKHQLPNALLALDAKLANANMLVNSLPGQIGDKESFIQKLSRDIQSVESSLKTAEDRTVSLTEIKSHKEEQTQMQTSLPEAIEMVASLKRNRDGIPGEMLRGHIDENVKNIVTE